MSYCQNPNTLLKTTVTLIDSIMEFLDEKQVQRVKHYRDEAMDISLLTNTQNIKLPANISGNDDKEILKNYKLYKNAYINRMLKKLFQDSVQYGGANIVQIMSKAYNTGVNMIYYMIMIVYCFPSIAYKTVTTTVSGHAQLYILDVLVSQKKVLPMGDLILYILVTGLTKSEKLDIFYPDNKKRYAAYYDVVMNSTIIKRDHKSAETVQSIFKFLLYLVMYTTTSQGEALKKRMQSFMTAMYGTPSGKRVESMTSMGNVFDIKAELDKQNNRLCKVSQETIDVERAKQFFATVMTTFEEMERHNLLNTENIDYIESRKVVENATRIFTAKYKRSIDITPKRDLGNNQALFDVLINEHGITPLGDEILFAVIAGMTGDESIRLFYGSEHEKRKTDYYRVLTSKDVRTLPIDLVVSLGMLIHNADIHSHCNHDLQEAMINLFSERKPLIPLNIMHLYRMVRSGTDSPRLPSDFRAIFHRIINTAETMDNQKLLESSSPLMRDSFIALETAFSIFEKRHGSFKMPRTEKRPLIISASPIIKSSVPVIIKKP